ncbi:MAG TPA: hypothetical protein VNR87_17545 [Flavisolibacter sp.]|nr:hypothetical protein [Flavisolibacter sp.]
MIKGFNVFPLLVEKTDQAVRGLVNINDSLIEDTEKTIDELICRMKEMVYEWEGIQVDGFDISYAKGV